MARSVTPLFPCVADEALMLDLKQAFIDDAAAYENIPDPLGRVLDKTVARHDQCHRSEPARARDSLSVFEGKTRCPLHPSQYLWRILQYTRTSPCNLLIGLIYLQRLKNQTDGQLALTSFNTQRLLLTASMLASKMYDDYYASNCQWALVGDLSLKELNGLELEMLWQLGFSLAVSREEFDHCYDQIMQMANEVSAAVETSAACSTSPISACLIAKRRGISRAGSDENLSTGSDSASDLYLSECGTVDTQGDLLHRTELMAECNSWSPSHHCGREE